MDVKNQLYRNQGMHVLLTLFTVEDNKFKVLFIKRRNEPFKDKWGLIGGACYNNETLDEALVRELKEKTGIKDINYKFFNLYSNVFRSPVMRMFASAYIGVINKDKVNFLKETTKTKDADWFAIDRIPALAYDHQEILSDAIEYMKTEIFNSNVLVNLFPKYFTLPEMHKAYEGILGKKLDRRNIRKKLLGQKIIFGTDKIESTSNKKPAKLYTTYLGLGTFEKRLRSCNNKFFFTEKEKKGLLRKEFEKEILKREYENLLKFKMGNTIVKDRFISPLNNYLNAELDYYHGVLYPLKTVEVEFKSVDEAKAFIPPQWFGEEVTGQKQYKNASLANAEQG